MDYVGDVVTGLFWGSVAVTAYFQARLAQKLVANGADGNLWMLAVSWSFAAASVVFLADMVHQRIIQ